MTRAEAKRFADLEQRLRHLEAHLQAAMIILEYRGQLDELPNRGRPNLFVVK